MNDYFIQSRNIDFERRQREKLTAAKEAEAMVMADHNYVQAQARKAEAAKEIDPRDDIRGVVKGLALVVAGFCMGVLVCMWGVIH